MHTIGIIDFGAGNLLSVKNALESIGVDHRIVDSPEKMEDLERVVLPGVGAFGDCMKHIRDRGLDEPIRAWIGADRPFMGICIGYQALFEGSEESPGVAGLGVYAGQVRRFKDQPGVKIPQMGWNRLELRHPEAWTWRGFPPEPHMYFVHSFYPCPEDEEMIASTTDYAGVEFASSVARGNLFATQFHPEKSQRVGLQLLRNFVEAEIPAGSGATD